MWGRKSYLWEALLAPVRKGYTWRPEPQLDLTVQFVGGALTMPTSADGPPPTPTPLTRHRR